MDFTVKVVLPVIVFFLGAHILAISVRTIAPVIIRVGMPWQEVEQQCDRVVCATGFSTDMFGAPIDEDTGRADYRVACRSYLFPNCRCVRVILRASREARDLEEYRVHSIGVGPPFRGPEQKFENNYPWSYPQEVNLGSYRWPVVIAWMIAAILSLYAGFRWLSAVLLDRRATPSVDSNDRHLPSQDVP